MHLEKTRTPGWHTTLDCPIHMHATVFMHSDHIDLCRRWAILQPAHAQAIHRSSAGGLQWSVQAIGPWRRPTACCHLAQLLRDVPQPHLPHSPVSWLVYTPLICAQTPMKCCNVM